MLSLDPFTMSLMEFLLNKKRSVRTGGKAFGIAICLYKCSQKKIRRHASILFSGVGGPLEAAEVTKDPVLGLSLPG